MTHTPGPWEFDLNPKWQSENGMSCELVVRPQGEFPHGLWIADCGLSVDPEHVANARLIASAPDLLAALEEATLRLTSLGQDILQQQAAITKARGPQASSPYLNKPLRTVEQAVRDSERKP